MKTSLTQRDGHNQLNIRSFLKLYKRCSLTKTSKTEKYQQLQINPFSVQLFYRLAKYNKIIHHLQGKQKQSLHSAEKQSNRFNRDSFRNRLTLFDKVIYKNNRKEEIISLCETTEHISGNFQ